MDIQCSQAKFALCEQTNKLTTSDCLLSLTCAMCIGDKDTNPVVQVCDKADRTFEYVCLVTWCKLSLAALLLTTKEIQEVWHLY